MGIAIQIKTGGVIGVILLCNAIFGQKNKLFPLTIQFQNQVGALPLSFDSIYTNAHGETFTVRNLRYYISHISVTNSTGKTYQLPDSYFLIDERKPESKRIPLQVPFASIKAIGFTIGVDSARNGSGVQTGALDPANGMFWTWNSGYIFAKLEGTSPQAKAPQNNFTYHIGGFRFKENAERKVILTLPEPTPIWQTSFYIIADINAWFNSIHPFKITDQPSIMVPGPQAMQVADNYSHMFSIVLGR